MNKEAVASVRDARNRYNNALKSNSMVRQQKERYVNILLSNAEELLKVADEYEELQEQFNLEIQENMKLAAKLKAAEAPTQNEAAEEKPSGKKAK